MISGIWFHLLLGIYPQGGASSNLFSMNVRGDIWAGRSVPGLKQSYRKIVVRSSERTEPSDSTDSYTNQIGHFHEILAPVNRICLSDFYLPASQWTIEEDWSRLYIMEGLYFPETQSLTVGIDYDLTVLPLHLSVTTITRGATVPVGLGGGTGVEILGDFEGSWGMAVDSLQKALGKSPVLVLRGVSGHPDLEIQADTIIGNTPTALYLSEEPGTPADSWTLVGSATAGALTLEPMSTPSQLARYLTEYIQLYTTVDSSGIYNPTIRWNLARGCFDMSWYGTPDLGRIPLTGSNALLLTMGFPTGGVITGTHSDHTPESDRTVFFTASSTLAPQLYSAMADIQPGNYGTRSDLAAAVDTALNSSQVASGLSINVKEGNTSGATTPVPIPSGRFNSSVGFASALEAEFTAAGFTCSVGASETGFDVVLNFTTPHRVEWNGNEAMFGRVNDVSLGKVHGPELPSRQLGFGLLDSYVTSLDSSGSRIVVTKDADSSLLVPSSVSGSGNLMTFSFASAHGLPVGIRLELSWDEAGGPKSAETVVVDVPTTDSLQVLISGTVAYTGTGATTKDAALHKVGNTSWALVTASTPRIHQALQTYRYENCITTRSLGLAPGLNSSNDSGTLIGLNAMDLTSSGYVLVNLIVNGVAAAGRTSHLAYNASKRLAKPLARICLDRGWLNAVEHDHRHCIDLDEKVVIGTVGVELLNSDHTPYKTHGLENSFTLMLDTHEMPIGLGTM